MSDRNVPSNSWIVAYATVRGPDLRVAHVVPSDLFDATCTRMGQRA